MNLLVKIDPELGYAYFCPACKRFLSSPAEACPFCGNPLDWDGEKALHRGAVKWPTAAELAAAANQRRGRNELL